MAIVILTVVGTVMLALVAVVVRALNQNRSNIYRHWYAVGRRDKDYGTFWYGINQLNALQQNAYMDGYHHK